MPFKAVGDLIYVVGETYDELGASAYYRWLAEAQGKPEAFGGAVPQVQGEQALALYRAMNQATAQGLLQSATSPSKGGLALALALATIGSEQGAQIDLSGVASDATVALFSESNSRFVISVKPEDQQGVEALFAGGSLQLIGEVVEGDALTLKGLATLEREAMRQRFKATLAGV
jgi:phosphoribosylformylglycinamidine synthase